MNIYDTDIFIGGIDEEYNCKICMFVLNKPVQCKQGHVYCEECFHTWLRDNKKECPLCREETTMNTLSRNRQTENMISKLQVRCIHGDDKSKTDNAAKRRTSREGNEICDWKGSHAGLMPHLTSECLFELVSCPNSTKGCGAKLQRDVIDEHMLTCPAVCPHCKTTVGVNSMQNHFDSCDMVEVVCPNEQCDVKCLRNQHKLVCEWTKIDCPFHIHGCNVNGTGQVLRRNMAEHQSDEANAHSLLVAASMAEMKTEMRAQATEMKTRLKALETQVTELKGYNKGAVIWNVKVNELAPESPMFSEPVDVSTIIGIYKCKLRMILSADGENIDIRIVVDGTHYPVFLDGSVITCCGITRTIFGKLELLAGSSMGWDNFITHQRAKDEAVDEHIQVTAAIQLKFSTCPQGRRDWWWQW